MLRALDEDAADDGMPADLDGARDPAAANFDGARILLAEDTPDNQRLISYHLERCSAEVQIVGDGQAAVDEALEAEHAGRPFDVILMDLQMPVMDGLEATRYIRSLEENRDRRTPIVAMTANAMTGDRERCLDAGMDGYVSKPVRRAILMEEMDRVRGIEKSEAAGEQNT